MILRVIEVSLTILLILAIITTIHGEDFAVADTSQDTAEDERVLVKIRHLVPFTSTYPGG